jgi:uncharacterized protein YndB with AHSA1/START domain
MIEKNIPINAHPAKVWKVLTKPEFTKLYMFGCEAVSTWEEGSSVEWKGILDNNETVLVRGNVQRVEPEKLLTYSTFDPQGGLPDIPENYLTVTYRLNKKGNQTILTVIQGDFAAVTEGPDRFEEAEKGWEATLPEIKRVAETEKEC